MFRSQGLSAKCAHGCWVSLFPGPLKGRAKEYIWIRTQMHSHAVTQTYRCIYIFYVIHNYTKLYTPTSQCLSNTTKLVLNFSIHAFVTSSPDSEAPGSHCPPCIYFCDQSPVCQQPVPHSCLQDSSLCWDISLHVRPPQPWPHAPEYTLTQQGL